MHATQLDVYNFHAAMLLPDGSGPFTRAELRARLILEEALETIAGLGFEVQASDDIGGYPVLVAETTVSLRQVTEVNELEVIDGLCDLIYVAEGCAVEMGIDLEPHQDEVQRANMAKVGGPVREDGKRLKPEGWTPPDHAPILERSRFLGNPGLVLTEITLPDDLA